MNSSLSLGLIALLSTSPLALQSAPLDHWTRTPLYSGPLGQYGAALGSIVYGNGRYVSVGSFVGSDFGYYAVSADGLNWATRPVGEFVPVLNLYSVCFGNGLFVACGYDWYSGVNLWTSADGLNWGSHPSGVANVYQVIWSGSQFVAAGEDVLPGFGGASTNRVIFTSSNGTNWVGRVISPGLHSMRSVAYGASRYIATDASGNLFSSTTGGTWTWNFDLGSNFGQVNFCNDRFIGTTLTGSNIVSFDGLSWAPLIKNVTNLLFRVVYSGGSYFGVSDSAVFTSLDTTNWTQCPISTPTSTRFSDVAVGPCNVVVIANENPLFPLLPVAYTSDPFVGISITNRSTRELLITGLQGRCCQIEYCDSLQSLPLVWQSLGTVCLTNPPARFTDLTPGGNQRFYRAVLLP